jgi:hypothetical protein
MATTALVPVRDAASRGYRQVLRLSVRLLAVGPGAGRRHKEVFH